MKKIKISRNQSCPCGSHLKYKKCCENKINWNQILRKNDSRLYFKNLSLRGKNDYFFSKIIDILEIEPKELYNNKKFKDTITPVRIRNIHELITNIWPCNDDLDRIFLENQNPNSAVYTGWYEPSLLIRGITRHSLYCEKIFIVDPFTDPRNIKDEFNPIIHPEKHIENTIKDIKIWLMLYPWINSGLVNFIRNPCDFNYPMMSECLKNAEQRNKNYPELEKLIYEIPPEVDEIMKQYHVLILPDEKILENIKELKININEDIIINYINKLRDEHPFFVPLVNSKYGSSRMLAFKTGANFDMMKLIASALNSHLITDLEYRWKEIEIEHKILNIKQNHWTSFAKALQKVNLNFLNNINIKNAIQIRNEKYLDKFRLFLSKLWNSSYKDDYYKEDNIFYLEEELKQRVDEAEIEWNDIKKKFISKISIGTAVSVGAYPTIANGSAEFLIGSLVLNGITNLGLSWLNKNNFKKKFPASFFLRINNR